MILDFLVINFLEQLLIFITVAYLINRKQYLVSNWRRILYGILAVLLTAFILHVFRSMPDVPLMEYRIPIQIVLFAMIYMFVLKLNWLQSVVGILIVLTTLSLSEGFSTIFLLFTNPTFSEGPLTLNSHMLPGILSARVFQTIILLIIARLGIVIKIPDRFRIEKMVCKLVGSLALLFFLVFGFLREVILGAERLQILYILTIAVAGGVLCVIIIDYVRKNALQLKEIDKTRRRMKTGEIWTEIIRNKNELVDSINK